MREKLNAALKQRCQEWEISREADPKPAYPHDKPYQDTGTVRVDGPFTVENLSPHRVLGVDENDDLIDQSAKARAEYAARQSFAQMVDKAMKVFRVT